MHAHANPLRCHKGLVPLFSLKHTIALTSSLSTQSADVSSTEGVINGDDMEVLMDQMLRGTVPECLSWLQALHNIIRYEHITHPYECISCHVMNFTGFMYGCTNCAGRLCQWCVWKGVHDGTHDVREFIGVPISSHNAPSSSSILLDAPQLFSRDFHPLSNQMHHALHNPSDLSSNVFVF
ncbi:hypothetical protein HELRODRAFT_158753 [Helobdella robusta]|uniref:ZZ-type domain-containing protein n=1 Tax=Helobdella robusta TaxID=6412 RepID=T1EN75_HELRO|nr:hypothetical protein HELRODRAFT_158753 [Helobdella robusta]ESO12272.1 hypothetical protein HELRODRAFT_158753 [Helobdella robusta]